MKSHNFILFLSECYSFKIIFLLVIMHRHSPFTIHLALISRVVNDLSNS